MRHLWLVTAGAATWACGAATHPVRGPSDASPITTDSAVYHLGRTGGAYQATAIATYVNRTGTHVFFARCNSNHRGPLYRLRRTGPDSAHRAFIGAAWACVGGVPTGSVPPGDTLRAAVWLGSTESPQAKPPITPDQRVGLFRIEFSLCAAPAPDSGECRHLPQAQRESNTFTVRF